MWRGVATQVRTHRTHGTQKIRRLRQDATPTDQTQGPFLLMYLVFVTGRGGAGFQSPEPALTRGRGVYVSGNHRPAPVRGPPALIPWTGPGLLPHIFNGNPSGVWVGSVPERGLGHGMPKKTASPPQAVEWGGAGKRAGGRRFRGPVRPVTNSNPITGMK